MVINFLSVLGIETSCDDTGCAVMQGNMILGEAIHTQRESVTFGGIIPTVAQAFHRQNIERIVAESLTQANVTVADLDAIAVTNRPGLKMSLTIGVRYARHLARKYQKPLIPIHHMQAHALTVRMTEKVDFPFLCLLISGGHSLLAFVKSIDEFLLLGESLDDAPGEAFDKIARYLKLSNLPQFANLSGGQSIEKAASSCTEVTDKYKFPLMLARYRDCQFSYAGIKNSAKRFVLEQQQLFNLDVDEVIPDYPDFCANFLGAITRHICHRTQRAMEFCERKNLFDGIEHKQLVVSGGVACNDFIFNALSEMCELMDYSAVRPTKKLCTDNGIMIAWNGIEKFVQNKDIIVPELVDDIEILGSCPIGQSLIDEVKGAGISCNWVKPKSLKPFMRCPQ